MKKINICLFSLLFTLLFFSGCKNSLSANYEASNKSEVSEISFAVSDAMNSARTAKPSFTWDEYNYELRAVAGYNPAQTPAQESTVLVQKKAFSNFETGTMKLPKGNYKFILSGYLGDTKIIQGESIIELTNDAQTVPFKMYPVSGNTGSISITLKFPVDNIIKTIKADVSDNKITAPSTEYSFGVVTDSAAQVSYNHAEINVSNIASATEKYCVINCFDANGKLVFDYAESLYVMGGKTSRATIELKAVDYYRNNASVTITKDGSTWTDSPSKIILQDKTDPSVKYELTGSNGVYTGTLPDGEYEIYIPSSNGNSDVDTGISYNSATKEYSPQNSNPNVVTVTLPADQGVTFTPGTGVVGGSGNTAVVPEGKDFETKVELKPGYEATDDKVTVAGQTVTSGSNVTINATESTNIAVTGPTAVEYTITYDLSGDNGAWNEGVTPGPVKYTVEDEVSLPLTGITKAGFTLAGWKISGTTATITAIPKGTTGNLTLVPVWNDAGNANYTVQIWYEKIDSADYEKISEEIKSASVNSTVSAPVTEITGFGTPAVTSGTVTADGSLVVTAKYPRNTYTITLKTEKGKWADNSTVQTVSGKFEAPATDAVNAKGKPVFEDWECTGWTPAVPATFTGNVELTAVWNQVNANYTVKTYFEKADNSKTEYEQNLTAYPDVTLKGKIGENATYVPGTIDGFELVTVTPVAITSDGLAVLEIKYNRKVITLTFDGNGGKWVDDSTSKTLQGKYGTSVGGVADPAYTNYSFDGWTPAVPSEFPAANAVYTAKWTQTDAAYKIEYYVENAAGEMILDHTSNALTGTIGTTPVIAAQDMPDMPGYNKAVVTAAITADGNAVQKVNYTRKTITYTFKLGGGKINGSTADYKVQGKYGTAVPAVPSPSYKDADGTSDKYVFRGWDSVGGTYAQTFGTDNKEYSAVWYSQISGIGENPLIKELTVNNTITGTKLVSQAVVPYSGNWTFAWYIDGVSAGSGTATETGAVITVENLTKRKHNVLIVATESGGNGIPSVTFTKEFEISIN